MRFVRLVLAVLILAAGCAPSEAIESVRVPLDSQAIDLTRAVESYSSQGDRLRRTLVLGKGRATLELSTESGTIRLTR